MAQGDIGQIGDVTPQRVLAIGTAIGVIEQESRQSASRCLAEIQRRRDDHTASLPGRRALPVRLVESRDR